MPPLLSSHQVYGRDTVFDADRLIDLLDAFETFTVASRSARGDMDLTEGGLMQTCTLLHVVVNARKRPCTSAGMAAAGMPM